MGSCFHLLFLRSLCPPLLGLFLLLLDMIPDGLPRPLEEGLFLDPKLGLWVPTLQTRGIEDQTLTTTGDTL